MILWAKAAAVGMPCNQRVELIEVVAGMLRVELCGTGEFALISPGETCGVEFDNTLEVFYDAKITQRKSFQGR